jgi:hypothetical protein
MLTPSHTPPSHAEVIDANMHWLPETLFSDEDLLAAFLQAPPREHGTLARLQQLANGSGREIVIEQPPGKAVLIALASHVRFSACRVGKSGCLSMSANGSTT